jgi:predicted dehydrogenase
MKNQPTKCPSRTLPVIEKQSTVSPTITRRRFVQGMTAVAAAPLIVSAASLKAGENRAPSDRVTLGFIGVGKMGRGHLGGFLGDGDVQVVAVCDVVAQRRDHAREMVEKRYAAARKAGTYRGCDAYGDFRELLAREDLDAVVIGTPDHWHAIPAVYAAQAGKDIYCEKPLSRTIGEGRKMVEAVRENKVVFQTGSQQRSEFGGRFRKAVELIRNGHIGQVKTIRVGVGTPNRPCDLPGQEIPEGTDWDFWVGPSAMRPYNEILCPKGIHDHFPAWRDYREFAGGGLADMGAHHFDIAQWALDMDHSGPVKVEPPTGDALSGLKLTYANGVEMFHGGPSGCSFEGTKGTIYVDRSVLKSDPEGILSHEIAADGFHAQPSNNQKRNWIEAIRSRQRPIADVEIGHRTATVCHLANLGYELRRPLKWDPQAERFVDDDQANGLIHQTMRSPWKI